MRAKTGGGILNPRPDRLLPARFYPMMVQGVDRREGDVDGTAQDGEGTEEGEGSKQGPLRQQNVPPR